MCQLNLDDVEKEFLRFLREEEVLYVLIGGHAVYYYGYERNINDLDVVVSTTEENPRRLWRVIEEDL